MLWSTLSHPHVLKLKGVYGDMESRIFTTVSEWMARGNIMGFIKKNHVNRLELVRDFTSPTLRELIRESSYMEQLRAWSTFMMPVSHTETSWELVLFVETNPPL